MKILVYLDQRDGKIKQGGLEALSIAQTLGASRDQIAAVVVGDRLDSLEKEIAEYGACKLYAVSNPELALFNSVNYCNALQAAIDDFQPKLVLGSASPMGKELFPRVAAKNDAGLITDVININLDNNEIVCSKPLYAGKCVGLYTFTQSSSLQLVTIRPNTTPIQKLEATTIDRINIDHEQDASELKTIEIRKAEGEKADLTEATLIISGGRALGSEENFKILTDCASTIGATVGASRAAVDSGYAPHDMQVGQTGKTVNPNLYIACGISGSIQHMAGMRTAKTIVAVNTDPDAPIFSIADYGIVGDLFEVVPALTEKFKDLPQG